jgi:hypothetical protein
MVDEETTKKNNHEGIVVPLIAAVICYFLFFHAKSDTYRAVYYIDKHNLTNYIKGPDFSSLEDARKWVYEQNRQRGNEGWDYEIGKNPKLSEYGDIEICEETLRKWSVAVRN